MSYERNIKVFKQIEIMSSKNYFNKTNNILLQLNNN